MLKIYFTYIYIAECDNMIQHVYIYISELVYTYMSASHSHQLLPPRGKCKTMADMASIGKGCSTSKKG
jgi:hypothetical protein